MHTSVNALMWCAVGLVLIFLLAFAQHTLAFTPEERDRIDRLVIPTEPIDPYTHQYADPYGTYYPTYRYPYVPPHVHCPKPSCESDLTLEALKSLVIK